MITFYLNDANIFYVRISDKISIGDIKDYLAEFKLIDYLPQKLILLYDLLDAELDISLDDINTISRIADEVTEKYLSVKTAFLVGNPNVTAYSFLFSELKDSKVKIRKIFSTLDAATSWLLEDSSK